MAVLAAEAPDVLSHAAARARNAGALMAACLSPQRFAELRELAGAYVRLTPSQVLNPCAVPSCKRFLCRMLQQCACMAWCRYGV